MKKINFLSGCSFLIVFIIIAVNKPALPHNDAIEKEIKKYTANLPFSFPDLRIPKFPEKSFNIKDFGAIGNGEFKNTVSINKAIAECSGSGGGHVIIPAGLWLTGPIKLMSNVDLHLEKGALVVFSGEHKDYEMINPTGSYICEMPISGSNLSNISISGEGIFDGNGDTWRPVKKAKMNESQWKELVNSGGVVDKKENIWWPSANAMNAEAFLAGKNKKEMTKEDYETVKDFLRPNMLQLNGCTDVILDGFTLQNSPKFHLYANKCKGMIVKNVKVMTDWWAQNGDGLDISACKNVIMFGCTVNAGDDGICMKSSTVKGETNALENIVIEDCVVYHAHGGFVIGSNTDGGIKNISVRNCNFIGTETGLRFKSNTGRGGIVEDIYIENIYMKNIKNEAIIFDMTYEDKAVGKSKETKPENSKIPYFTNFKMSNIFCDGAERAFLVDGKEDCTIKNIYLANAVIKSKYGFEGRFAEGFEFTDVKIIPEKGEVYKIEQGKNFLIKNGICPDNCENFIKLTGANTKGIVIEKTDLTKCKKSFELMPEVDKSAITIK